MSNPSQAKPRPLRKTALTHFFVVLFFSAALFFTLDSYVFTIKGMQFRADLKPHYRGITEIRIPPIGGISASTHLLPFKLELSLLNIDTDALQEALRENPTSAGILAETQKELTGILLNYFLRLTLLAASGGLLGGMIISGCRLRPALSGALAGLAISVLAILLTYATYDVERLRTPEYHGILKAAPWAISLADNAFQKVRLLSEQMAVITGNLYAIYKKIDEIRPIDGNADDLLVLHVSDIHNNPAAHKFLLQITRSFPIDFVIDTGDISDYGTPLEGSLLTGLIELNIPYLFVPGNHDSPEIIQAMSRYPQVRVLTDGMTEIRGLRILALADPAAASSRIIVSESGVVSKARDHLLRLWQETALKPNIAAVHNFSIAEVLVDRVPLILHGHNHQLGIQKVKETVIIGAGTTGGAGLRGLQAVKEIPFSVVLLHFGRDEKREWRLYAADSIKLYNLEQGFVLERKIF